MTDPILGPTGEFPQGKFHESDQGALQLAVANHQGKVLVKFGTPVAWLGLDPSDAVQLASMLIKQARQAAKAAGVVLEVKL